METHILQPVGIVHSPYKEKFGIPRQPGLVDITSQIEILPPYNVKEAFGGLEQFSHIWVSFVFHQVQGHSWKPLVRPPRLGGNEKTGVFATRSPFRPNNLGLSVVRLREIEFRNKNIILSVAGLDCVDQTPVVDIKPYVPYADCIPDASGGFAVKPPVAEMSVSFADSVENFLLTVDPQLRESIIRILSFDVRPAYRHEEGSGKYCINFDKFNICWKVDGKNLMVMAIDPL